MPGNLNIFQMTMLQWNEMYPYNAVHVVRVPRRIELPRLSDAINTLLESYGLTGLVVNKRRGTFHYHGGRAHSEIKVITGVNDPRSALGSEIERQLNTPFTIERQSNAPSSEETKINPFRFFVVGEEDYFYLGLVYLHFISGAEPIVFLLKNIVSMYMNKKTQGD